MEEKIILDGSKDIAAIHKARQMAEAEERAKQDALPESKRYFLLQEIRTSPYTVVRRRVLVTPSMCTHRGCGFDAAKDVGYGGGWSDPKLNHDQSLPSGKTIGQAIMDLLEVHMINKHAIIETDAHLMTEEQLNRQKQWAGVPGAFLTNPGRG
jgi:hypothetical protein